MKISYLITCSNETETLDRLLNRILSVLGNDELIILQDKNHFVSHNETYEIIISAIGNIDIPHVPNIMHITHPLNNNYGAHKNYGIEQCSGDYIFQIDGDELPSEYIIGENLHAIIESNPTIEAYAVPRINDFKGVTEEHAKQWGWRLDISPTYNRPRVSWPDWQFRIFKRDYSRISFNRRLHEKIEGYSSYVRLPENENYALLHDKTIAKQIETNQRYNKLFSADENKGHNVFGAK